MRAATPTDVPDMSDLLIAMAHWELSRLAGWAGRFEDAELHRGSTRQKLRWFEQVGVFDLDSRLRRARHLRSL